MGFRKNQHHIRSLKRFENQIFQSHWEKVNQRAVRDKRQRILKWQAKMDNLEKLANIFFCKRQRIPKGQSKMDNLEKLVANGTQDEGK